MPRRIRLLILFLLFGAAVNILLAWSLCITIKRSSSAARTTRSSARTTDLPPATWPYSEGLEHGTPSQFMRISSWNFTSDFGFWSGEHRSNADHDFAVDIINAGLPFRSFRSRFEGEWNNTQLIHGDFLDCLRFDTPFAAATLPYAPIWTGLGLNTLLFAALGWSLFRGPRALRRFRRARKNRCLTCGYDRAGLDTSSPCPECGQPPQNTR